MSLVSMGAFCVACVSCAAAGIETNDAQKMAQNTVKQGARFRLVILRAAARGQLIFISLLRVKTADRKLIRLVNLPSAFTRPRRQELQETWKSLGARASLHAWLRLPGLCRKPRAQGCVRSQKFRTDNP